jgi:hypothetical protein
VGFIGGASCVGGKEFLVSNYLWSPDGVGWHV